jgi:hypothetical protein
VDAILPAPLSQASEVAFEREHAQTSVARDGSGVWGSDAADARPIDDGPAPHPGVGVIEAGVPAVASAPQVSADAKQAISPVIPGPRRCRDRSP